MSTTKELAWPTDIPCLVLEWEQTAADQWEVRYFLSLPIDPGDIRRESEDAECFLRLPMGTTTTTTSRPDPWRDERDGREIVGTPYRDGAHARWDSARLRIPAYAVYGDRRTFIQPDDPAAVVERARRRLATPTPEPAHD